MLLIIILLVLLLGGGGYGYRTYGPVGGSEIVGTLLIVILVLWLVGALGGPHRSSHAHLRTDRGGHYWFGGTDRAASDWCDLEVCPDGGGRRLRGGTADRPLVARKSLRRGQRSICQFLFQFNVFIMVYGAPLNALMIV